MGFLSQHFIWLTRTFRAKTPYEGFYESRLPLNCFSSWFEELRATQEAHLPRRPGCTQAGICSIAGTQGRLHGQPGPARTWTQSLHAQDHQVGAYFYCRLQALGFEEADSRRQSHWLCTGPGRTHSPGAGRVWELHLRSIKQMLPPARAGCSGTPLGFPAPGSAGTDQELHLFQDQTELTSTRHTGNTQVSTVEPLATQKAHGGGSLCSWPTLELHAVLHTYWTGQKN